MSYTVGIDQPSSRIAQDLYFPVFVLKDSRNVNNITSSISKIFKKTVFYNFYEVFTAPVK